MAGASVIEEVGLLADIAALANHHRPPGQCKEPERRQQRQQQPASIRPARPRSDEDSNRDQRRRGVVVGEQGDQRQRERKQCARPRGAVLLRADKGQRGGEREGRQQRVVLHFLGKLNLRLCHCHQRGGPERRGRAVQSPGDAVEQHNARERRHEGKRSCAGLGVAKDGAPAAQHQIGDWRLQVMIELKRDPPPRQGIADVEVGRGRPDRLISRQRQEGVVVPEGGFDAEGFVEPEALGAQVPEAQPRGRKDDQSKDQLGP